MRVKLDAMLATLTAILLVMGGLWLWTFAVRVSDESDNGERHLYAVRCAAVGALAGAQVLGLGVIARAVFDRDSVSDVLRGTAALVCTAAVATSLALLWTET